MKEKSIKNIRQKFKDHGIFYTPPELAKKLLSYVDIHPESVYDPTCGAGNLLKVFPDDVKKYGQELDPEQLALIGLTGFIGYAGDTLTDDGFAGQKFDCIVANPPFSIRWNPETMKNDERFSCCPVLPPPSKADWAFMLHILSHLSDDGVAVVLEFPGVLYRGQREGRVRQWFVENNYIDRVVNIPGNTFEDTSIATCIVVLKRNRDTTDVIFEDGNRAEAVSLEEIKRNGFTLSVNAYLQDDTPKERINIDEVNRTVVKCVIEKVKQTFETFREIENVFGDNGCLQVLASGLREVLQKYAGD